TRASDTIFGHSLLAFHEEGVVLRLFQSVFVFPEFCRSGWYFKSLQLSISPPVLYIPLFTVIGVILIWRRDRKSWYHYLISLCAVFACVPLFNSAFSAFNYNYYGRWLFMPLLIMVMMTGKYLDDFRSFAPRKLLLGYAAVLGFWILYGIYSVFFEENVAQDSTDLWPSAVAVAVMGVLILYLMHYPEQKIRFISFDRIRPIVCLCCFLPLLCSSAYLFRFSDNEFLQKQRAKIWNDFQPVHLEDDNEFFRTSCVLFPTLNASMMWDYPTINHFNSMITSDTCDFMNAADVICGQNPVLSEDDYALCSFLSVKYELFHNGLLTGGIHVEPEDINKEIEGFEQEPEQHRYIPFRNKAFIPMGYTFDYYLEEDFITEEDTDADEAADDEDHLFLEAEDEEEVFYTDHVDRQKLLLKAIWLTKSQVKKYGGFLKELPKELHDDVSVETYYKDCAARAASACYEFSPDGTGFTARINLPKENLVFFSVPYNKNFTAYVDGKETEIERIFNGLCAVYAPEGDHEIVFRYEIPWFKLGCLVSAGCAAVLLIYTAADLLYKRREKKKAAAASA
ncbi:MAG: YfhO family protein, partial [Oscillospiraceae bacterium]|nr:YfhO family protein [Oscillospiraceae bacterium]